jgi:chemotaxis protein MotB
VADDKPIIIIKKKGGHGGHHGGAWKVAYADFVTAMMAFFMVMWLVSSAQSTTKQAIASYFRKPGIFTSGSGTPLMVGEAGILKDAYVPPHPEDTKQTTSGASKKELSGKTGTDSDTTGDKRVSYRGLEGKRDSVPDRDAAQRGFLSEEPDRLSHASEFAIIDETDPDKRVEDVGNPDSTGPRRERTNLGEQDQKTGSDGERGEGLSPAGLQRETIKLQGQQLRQALLATPEFQNMMGLVDVKLEADGLNIEIMDTEKISMFQSGSARILPDAEEAFAKIGPLIAQFPNTVDIVGHTDSKPFGKAPGSYSNWDLSADRANAARKLLERNGVPPERIASVSGRADKELKFKADPFAAANRRITLKVRLLAPTPTPVAAVQTPAAAQGAISPAIPGAQAGSAKAPPTMSPEGSTTGRSPSDTPAAAETAASDGRSTAQKIAEEIRRYKAPEKVEGKAVPTENPAPLGKDKIFGDNPVVGPRNLFANP